MSILNLSGTKKDINKELYDPQHPICAETQPFDFVSAAKSLMIEIAPCHG